MDEQGPAVKPIAIKFSSCRGVAFEIKPSPASPFALDAASAACAAEQPQTVSNAGRWVWFPPPFNRQYTSTTYRSSHSRATSSHFCDLDEEEDDDDDDTDDDESFAADEDEEMALASDVRSCRSRRSLASSVKPARAAAKGHSRLGVILLDQGLFTVYKRLFVKYQVQIS